MALNGWKKQGECWVHDSQGLRGVIYPDLSFALLSGGHEVLPVSCSRQIKSVRHARAVVRSFARAILHTNADNWGYE